MTPGDSMRLGARILSPVQWAFTDLERTFQLRPEGREDVDDPTAEDPVVAAVPSAPLLQSKRGSTDPDVADHSPLGELSTPASLRSRPRVPKAARTAHAPEVPQADSLRSRQVRDAADVASKRRSTTPESPNPAPGVGGPSGPGVAHEAPTATRAPIGAVRDGGSVPVPASRVAGRRVAVTSALPTDATVGIAGGAAQPLPRVASPKRAVSALRKASIKPHDLPDLSRAALSEVAPPTQVALVAGDQPALIERSISSATRPAPSAALESGIPPTTQSLAPANVAAPTVDSGRGSSDWPAPIEPSGRSGTRTSSTATPASGAPPTTQSVAPATVAAPAVNSGRGSSDLPAPAKPFSPPGGIDMTPRRSVVATSASPPAPRRFAPSRGMIPVASPKLSQMTQSARRSSISNPGRGDPGLDAIRSTALATGPTLRTSVSPVVVSSPAHRPKSPAYRVHGTSAAVAESLSAKLVQAVPALADPKAPPHTVHVHLTQTQPAPVLDHDALEEALVDILRESARRHGIEV